MIARAGRGLFVILVFALILASHPYASSALQDQTPQPDVTIAADVLAQIDALIREKENRSGIQRKLDSQLVYEVKMWRGENLARGVDWLVTDVEYADDTRVIVDVTAEVTPAFVEQLRNSGYDVQHATADSVRVLADVFTLEALAAMPQVRYVQPKQNAMTSRAKGTGRGTVTTEGDVTHRVFGARGAFGINGSGIKIGVLSDGVASLAQSQARGDLGAVTVLPGQAGSGDEGTAMLEIIHDLAPGAELYFATALPTINNFAANIRALREAGCDIIVDDVFYFAESPFHDGQPNGVSSIRNSGIVTQAVNEVIASGAMYFSSAGNSGNKNDNTSGVWEGDFASGPGSVAPLTVGQFHLFAPGQITNQLIAAAATSGTPVVLHWSDPIGGSANDYDLFVLNAAGNTLLGASTNIQDGDDDPFEFIGQATGVRYVIVKRTNAAPRFLHLNSNRGRFGISTDGQVAGHSNAAGAFSVAATPALAAFPLGFNGTHKVESFSSDGPRRMFFNGNGEPFTPGNFLSSGGELRQKPDITAADGVSVTGVGGFGSPFFGTSAAAPHAAAIAALIKSANASFTNDQVRAALISTAIDIEAPGVDRDSGVGIIMPVQALQALGLSGTAYLAGLATAEENPGNGNGTVNAGEGARMTVTLHNVGAAEARNITAVVSSPSSGVSLTQPAVASYADLAALSGNGTNDRPFLFTLAPNVSCPFEAEFALHASYNGTTQEVPVFLPTGPGDVIISGKIGTVASLPPFISGETGTQTGRLFRDGVGSVCGTQKPTPALTTLAQPAGAPDLAQRAFDAYTVNTCADAPPACATATVQGPDAVNLFTAAYTAPFTPSDIRQNYRADAGFSASSRAYGFDLPAGATQSTIVVHDVTAAAAASGRTYSIRLSGLCAGACATPNTLPVAKTRNVTVAAGPDCTAPASVDDGSFDQEGAVTVIASPAGPYPLGTTNVLLTVTDAFGATSQATGAVTVVDRTAPTVTNVSASPNAIWPPNHQMVDVTLGYNVADTCNATSCTLSVTSNEPVNGEGDGNTEVDWEVLDANRIRVRAERSGAGSGRVYTIAVTCTDAAGNVTVKTTTVNVAK